MSDLKLTPVFWDKSDPDFVKKVFYADDPREVKCAKDEPGTIHSGVSIDYGQEEKPVLAFHFIDTETNDQATLFIAQQKHMYLDKTNVQQLIDLLTEFQKTLHP